MKKYFHNEIELTNHKVNAEKIHQWWTIKLEKEITSKKTEEALSVALDHAEVQTEQNQFLFTVSGIVKREHPLVEWVILICCDRYWGVRGAEMAEEINRTGKRLLNTLSLVLDLARVK